MPAPDAQQGEQMADKDKIQWIKAGSVVAWVTSRDG